MDQTPAPPPIGEIWQPPQPQQSYAGFAKAAVFVAGAAVGLLIAILLLVILVSASLLHTFSLHF